MALMFTYLLNSLISMELAVFLSPAVAAGLVVLAALFLPSDKSELELAPLLLSTGWRTPEPLPREDF